MVDCWLTDPPEAAEVGVCWLDVTVDKLAELIDDTDPVGDAVKPTDMHSVTPLAVGSR